MSGLEKLLKIADAERDVPDNEPEYESPYRSEWIVSVDDIGYVDIMRWPNIHPCYLDEGINAEMLGMPQQVKDPAGVYKWICVPWETHDWESGYLDNWGFNVVESSLMFLLPEKVNGEVNKSGNEETQSDNGSGGI